MIIDGFWEKLVFAAILLGLVFAFLILRALGQMAGKVVKGLRDMPGRSAYSSYSGSASAGSGGFRRRAAGGSAGEPMLHHPVLGAMTAEEILQQIIEDNAPPPPHEGPLPDGIDAARRRAIVFRQSLPLGPGQDGFSFFGGQPIGPAHFEWPRSRGSEGVPLTFIMQWDCAQLAQEDPTGLMPNDGVLYCFIDLTWGNGDDQARIEAFLHHPGPTEGWTEIPLPADAPPIFGDEHGPRYTTACTDKIDNAADYVPRVMPRFPFTPIGLDLPIAAEFGEDESARLFWDEVPPLTEALLAIEKRGAQDGPIPDAPELYGPFRRPFPAYPHDFAAVRHLAVKMIKDLSWNSGASGKRHFPDLSDEERTALLAGWMDEAKELYRLGCQRPMATPLDQAIADDIWQWLETRSTFLAHGFDGYAIEAVDLSLGVGSRALDRIPQEWIAAAMRNHSLASEEMVTETFDKERHGTYEDYQRLKAAGALRKSRRLHAPPPAHMFGPPSYVQGYVEEVVDEQILLLELPSHGAPGLAIGDGVLQYMIRPEDLAARRFDRVKSVISGY